MKLPSSSRRRTLAARPRLRRLAMTLPEMMIAMTVFCIAMAGVIASHLFGLHLLQVVTPKLGASDEARAAVSKLINDIRSAKLVRIGTGTLNSFTEVGVNSLQQGSSIQVYPTLDTNIWTRYFWDTADQKLKKTTNGSSAVLIVANSISNSMVFSAEDYNGSIHTNNYNNRVIGLKLEFYQIQYPKMAVGPGQYYDYYQLHTRITRRTIL
jgi:prepilin-type N-terminal cleavage/methylation domain-containing protein